MTEDFFERFCNSLTDVEKAVLLEKIAADYRAKARAESSRENGRKGGRPKKLVITEADGFVPKDNEPMCF